MLHAARDLMGVHSAIPRIAVGLSVHSIAAIYRASARVAAHAGQVLGHAMTMVGTKQIVVRELVVIVSVMVRAILGTATATGNGYDANEHLATTRDQIRQADGYHDTYFGTRLLGRKLSAYSCHSDPGRYHWYSYAYIAMRS